MNKKFNGIHKAYKNQHQEKTYLQNRLASLMPTLMKKVMQTQDGKFVFTHATFPDVRVEGMTIGFVEEHLERAITRLCREQSNKHIDYLLNLLIK